MDEIDRLRAELRETKMRMLTTSGETVIALVEASEAKAEVDRLRAELAEQSRLLAMSGEREAKLIAQRDRLAKALRGVMLAEPGYPWGGMSESESKSFDEGMAALESLK